jgi:hypothetical protein
MADHRQFAADQRQHLWAPDDGIALQVLADARHPGDPVEEGADQGHQRQHRERVPAFGLHRNHHAQRDA